MIQGDPNTIKWRCIIQARIDKLNQEKVLSDLAKSDGNIRTLIVTISYET